MSDYDEGVMWEEYWAEEELAFRERSRLDIELAQQSRQIQYEAEVRRGDLD